VSTLRIVSVNDVYSLENLPRLKNLVRHFRTAPGASAVIVVLAGDFVAPSLLSSLDCGRGMIDCMNDVGFTHVILGNHEDDIPIVELQQRALESNATWIGTNCAPSEKMKHDDVIDVDGARVGLLGVVVVDQNLYRGPPFGGAPIEAANPCALREAQKLVDEGCVCVVPITHQSIEDDRALARGRGALPIPAIIGGHEHTQFLEQIDGTWIVKAGSDALAAVITEITLPAMTATAHIEPVSNFPEDAELRERVTEHMSKVHEIEAASLVLLAPGEMLSSVGSRHQQTSIGTLLCSRLRDALGADHCIFNGGGIRAQRDYKNRLTYGDVKAELPFDNEIVVVRMPGRVLRESIVASRAHAPADSGAFLQIDDALDPNALDDAREYSVAIVRNLLGGMDHIDPLVKWAHDNPDRIPPLLSGRDVKHVIVDAFAVNLWRKLGGFDEIDADHDGVLSEPEVAAAIARVTAEAPSHVIAQLLVHAIDQNADDVISPSELDAIAAKR
jgi:2',3'-cyclic-nucleotide 2'-phosphodiesterase (5'-nucleotidase family)